LGPRDASIRSLNTESRITLANIGVSGIPLVALGPLTARRVIVTRSFASDRITINSGRKNAVLALFRFVHAVRICLTLSSCGTRRKRAIIRFTLTSVTATRSFSWGVSWGVSRCGVSGCGVSWGRFIHDIVGAIPYCP